MCTLLSESLRTLIKVYSEFQLKASPMQWECNGHRYLGSGWRMCIHSRFTLWSSVSTGKRICIGESIANAELFLFFTTILQNFSVASPVAPEDIDITPLEFGVSQVPPKYQIRFLSRWGLWREGSHNFRVMKHPHLYRRWTWLAPCFPASERPTISQYPSAFLGAISMQFISFRHAAALLNDSRKRFPFLH